MSTVYANCFYASSIILYLILESAVKAICEYLRRYGSIQELAVKYEIYPL